MEENLLQSLETYLTSYWRRENSKASRQFVKVEFYNYSAITIKIFVKKYGLLIRYNKRLPMNDIEALKAGGRMMIHKIMRRRPLATDRVIFQQYSAEIEPYIGNPDRIDKLINDAEGKHYDLDHLYEKVINLHFNGEKPANLKTGWSKKSVRSYYAHYRKDYNLITFNSILDNAKIPGYVMEYLMYHEILHAIYPSRIVKNRLSKHPAEFRRKERQFPEFKRARQWLKENARKLIR
ncbi:MAG: M48 family metallopeptidase [Acidobacteria bacterium]|nr:M48 family metallopeptidase [Acidobacteriota bacterium]